MFAAFIVFSLILLALGQALLWPVIRFLRQHGVTAANYRNERIPNGLGLYLWLLVVASYGLWKLIPTLPERMHHLFAPWLENSFTQRFSASVFVLTLVFIVGWFDDSLGDKSVKGIRGHWNKWRREKLVTTGLMKAAAIGGLAVWLVFAEIRPTDHFMMSVLQSALIALMSNTVNLLDLRPGRALKGFLLLAAFLVLSAAWLLIRMETADQAAAGGAGNGALGFAFLGVWILLPVAAGALFLLNKDLKAQVMLGDTGANLLGFALGIAFVTAGPTWLQVIMLFMLIGLHWYAERSSVTSAIERNKWLNWLDRLGRV